MRVCIVIPAYEPGGEFVPYAQEVLAAGLPVLVVDDGSGAGVWRRYSRRWRRWAARC